MIVNLDSTRYRDAALANGGRLIGAYSDGWLVEVTATRIGDISYRLPDGQIIRRYRHPVVSGTYRQLDEGSTDGRRGPRPLLAPARPSPAGA